MTASGLPAALMRPATSTGLDWLLLPLLNDRVDEAVEMVVSMEAFRGGPLGTSPEAAMTGAAIGGLGAAFGGGRPCEGVGPEATGSETLRVSFVTLGKFNLRSMRRETACSGNERGLELRQQRATRALQNEPGYFLVRRRRAGRVAVEGRVAHRFL